MKGEQGTPFFAWSCREQQGSQGHPPVRATSSSLHTQMHCPESQPQASGGPRGWELPPEQPRSRFLSSPAPLSPGGPKPAGRLVGMAAPGSRPPRLQSALSHAVSCACLTDLRSERLFVFLLSPLHPPYVCLSEYERATSGALSPSKYPCHPGDLLLPP